MAERANELKDDLDRQRAGISHTVDQIENRVLPGRVLSRRKYQVRRSVVDWRDRVFGNDDPTYPPHWYGMDPRGLPAVYPAGYPANSGSGHDDGGGGVGDAMHRAQDRASGMAHEVGDQVRHAPDMVRQQTQGAPIGVGLIAFGAGLLIASLLPSSEREQGLVHDAEPQMRRAVEGAKSAAGEVADDLREPARDAVEEVRQTAAEEGREFASEAKHEAKEAREDVGSAVRDR